MCQPFGILQDPLDLKSSLSSYFIGPYNLQISSDFCYCLIYDTFISNFILNGPVMNILPNERDVLNSNPSEVFTFSNIFVSNNEAFSHYLQSCVNVETLAQHNRNLCLLHLVAHIHIWLPRAYSILLPNNNAP